MPQHSPTTAQHHSLVNLAAAAVARLPLHSATTCSVRTAATVAAGMHTKSQNQKQLRGLVSPAAAAVGRLHPPTVTTCCAQAAAMAAAGMRMQRQTKHQRQGQHQGSLAAAAVARQHPRSAITTYALAAVVAAAGMRTQTLQMTRSRSRSSTSHSPSRSSSGNALAAVSRPRGTVSCSVAAPAAPLCRMAPACFIPTGCSRSCGISLNLQHIQHRQQLQQPTMKRAQTGMKSLTMGSCCLRPHLSSSSSDRGAASVARQQQ